MCHTKKRNRAMKRIFIKPIVWIATKYWIFKGKAIAIWHIMQSDLFVVFTNKKDSGCVKLSRMQYRTTDWEMKQITDIICEQTEKATADMLNAVITINKKL